MWGFLHHPQTDFSLRTFRVYLAAIAGALREQYGDDEKAIVDDIVHCVPEANPRVKRDMADVERSLRRAWTTELLIRQAHDPALALSARSAALSWLPAQAYYAAHAALDALLVTHGAQTTNHMKALNCYESVVRRKIPAWVLKLSCTGCDGAWSYNDFPHAPVKCTVTTPGVNAQEWCNHLAVALRTTREADAENSIDQWKRAQKRTRIPADKKNDIVTRRDATNVLHVLWRLRRRANYGDIDMFYPDADRAKDLTAFSNDYVLTVKFMVAAFEALIERRIGKAALEKMLRKFPTAADGPQDFLGVRWAL